MYLCLHRTLCDNYLIKYTVQSQNTLKKNMMVMSCSSHSLKMQSPKHFYSQKYNIDGWRRKCYEPWIFSALSTFWGRELTVSTCLQSSTISCLLSRKASGRLASPSRELPAVKEVIMWSGTLIIIIICNNL